MTFITPAHIASKMGKSVRIDNPNDSDSKWIALEIMEMIVVPHVSESILLPRHKTVSNPPVTPATDD